MRIFCKMFNKKLLYTHGHLLFFGTKITISSRYVTHVSPRRDVCSSLLVKYLHIHILDLKLKKFDFFMVSFLTFLVLVKFPPCFVTTGWDSKQEIYRSQLEGANSWRLDRLQERISCPDICLKIHQNFCTNTNCHDIKVTLHFISYLLLFKTNQYACMNK